MTPLRLAVAGAAGRTGRAVVRRAHEDPAFELVAALTAAEDPLLGRDAGRVAGLDPIGLPLTIEVATGCDVLVDFTLPAGTVAWARWCGREGVPLVSGTTGLDESQQAVLHDAAGRIPVLWAPNMSIGINLMLALVKELAAALDPDWDVEICETHHRHKIDAPSGTAGALAEAIFAGRGQASDAAVVHGRSGHCGPRPAGQIGVHALRMGELVGEHEVHFTCDTEALTLRHRAFSREVFAVGALHAARWLHGKPPGRYQMRDVLTR